MAHLQRRQRQLRLDGHADSAGIAEQLDGVVEHLDVGGPEQNLHERASERVPLRPPAGPQPAAPSHSRPPATSGSLLPWLSIPHTSHARQPAGKLQGSCRGALAGPGARCGRTWKEAAMPGYSFFGCG